ncbi:MAG: DUF6982 domain-containing protein [Acidobacteriaceae bacterium]
MAKSRKKIIARRLTQEWTAGYLPSEGFFRNGMIELLALDGKIVPIDAATLKWICYVRDFNSGEIANPERLLRKTFAGRPRTEGLLVRLRLADGELLEGLASNDLSLISGEGVFLTPPDVRSNTQRMWIPPSSVKEMQIVAVIGAGSKRKRQERPGSPFEQEQLFP